MSVDFARGRADARDPRVSAFRKLEQGIEESHAVTLEPSEARAALKALKLWRLREHEEFVPGMPLYGRDRCLATGGLHDYQGALVGDWEDPNHGYCSDCGATFDNGAWTAAPRDLAAPVPPGAGDNGAGRSLPGSCPAPTICKIPMKGQADEAAAPSGSPANGMGFAPCSSPWIDDEIPSAGRLPEPIEGRDGGRGEAEREEGSGDQGARLSALEQH